MSRAHMSNRRSRSAIRSLQSRRMFVEPLENRNLLATITVTGTGDAFDLDNLTALREAIDSVNLQSDTNADVTLNRSGIYASLPGGTPDVINFNIAGAGVHKISAVTSQPTIARPVLINGYSQPGASVNTLANADNAVILIQLDGANAVVAGEALTLGAGSGGSTIRGLDITNFSGDGIVVQSNGNSIIGNFIGVDPTGTMRAPNGVFPASGDGILVVSGSSNQIGSINKADRNIVSGNSLSGIHIVGTLNAPAQFNHVLGNFVGVGADGKSGVGTRTEPAPAPGSVEGNNLFGIEISGGTSNEIGGLGGRNVIGFNADGIELDNGAQQNTFVENYVGLGADGVTAAGNLLHGIALRSSNGFNPPLGPAQPNEPGVSFNTIGGTFLGAVNFVAYNGASGIAIFGNPVSASGQANVGNAIVGNSIFQNGRSYLTVASAPTPLVGIDLTNGFVFPKDDGATPNDSQGHGAANDPNNFQNAPVLTSANTNGTTTTISGTLHGTPNQNFRIELFANDIDPLGLPAEGRIILDFINVNTNASGDVTFSKTVNVGVDTSQTITATATEATGNTSEFSAGIAVTFGLPTCNIETLNSVGAAGTATIESDLDHPGDEVLIVTGTSKNDVIIVEPRPSNTTQVRVKNTGKLLGIFDNATFAHIVVFAQGGNDTVIVDPRIHLSTILFGGIGNDVLYGGGGDDQISGDDGNDVIFGGAGIDTLCGDNGNDVVQGGQGNDTLFGEVGNDTLRGDAGDDLLLGDIGNDTLDGGIGNDHLYGQLGNDTLLGGIGNNIVVGGDGNDKIIALVGRNILIGGNGADKLYGNAKDDILIAGSTAHDEDDAALLAILDEWTSGDSYDNRVSFIRNGGGANGAAIFDDTTVFDDGLADLLVGDGGRDWYWAGVKDKIQGKASNEIVN